MCLNTHADSSDDVHRVWVPQIEYYGYKTFAELRYCVELRDTVLGGCTGISLL